ncbi:PREDICTED: uncharacterized protein LOC106809599 [Priapulus caudatus]|uniref:Uncharacterized protein LOC106809599 n=1 Tax=Priapulus caudatus TaxID=37621 RepID=A0ABM1E7P8_PRICU|nr:PREDICTED: uncharacterized protein LOC106809599 [Priapulus caudatus]
MAQDGPLVLFIFAVILQYQTAATSDAVNETSSLVKPVPALVYTEYEAARTVRDRDQTYRNYLRNARLNRPDVDRYTVEERRTSFIDKGDQIAHKQYERKQHREDYHGPDERRHYRYSDYADVDDDYRLTDHVTYHQFDDELGTHHRHTQYVILHDDDVTGGYIKYVGYITKATPFGIKIVAVAKPYYRRYGNYAAATSGRPKETPYNDLDGNYGGFYSLRGLRHARTYRPPEGAMTARKRIDDASVGYRRRAIPSGDVNQSFSPVIRKRSGHQQSATNVGIVPQETTADKMEAKTLSRRSPVTPKHRRRGSPLEVAANRRREITYDHQAARRDSYTGKQSSTQRAYGAGSPIDRKPHKDPYGYPVYEYTPAAGVHGYGPVGYGSGQHAYTLKSYP